jgi:hypothetical protein
VASRTCRLSLSPRLAFEKYRLKVEDDRRLVLKDHDTDHRFDHDRYGCSTISMFLRRRRSLDDQDDAVSCSTDDQTLFHRNSNRDNDFFGEYVSDLPQQRYPYLKQVVSMVVLMILLIMVVVLYGQDLLLGSSNLPRQKQQASGIRGELARDYHYWSSQEIHQTLLEWNTSAFPSFVHLTSAQASYNLPTPGTDKDCPFDATTAGCQTWILSIQVPPPSRRRSSDTPLRRKGSKPQVFLSGALHGDERVGPTVVMETVSLLLQVAKVADACPAGGPKNTLLLPVLSSPCRSLARKLEQHWGISTEERKWLLRLVQTRHILMIPTANALGYFRNEREEGNIDPNRDFPYDIGENEGCLESVAARSIVSLLQGELVQLGITFHAGTESITYEWGAYSHSVDEQGAAPDVVSQHQMAQAYQQFSATHSHDKTLQKLLYPIGTMNELVYPVHGGMEDWGYAASWDIAAVAHDCSGAPLHSFNSTTVIPKNNDGSFRIFTALVETSQDKQPGVDTLGRSDQVLMPRSSGYINRNVRLSLAMLDLVEPYVAIETADDVILQDIDDFISCPTNTISVSLDRESLDITWRVGGAVTVQETQLIYGTESQLGDELWSYCHSDATQPHPSFVSQPRDSILTTTYQSGTTQWHTHTGETIFRATLQLSKLTEPIRVFAVARVDADWSGGQTHVARVRTDPDWFYQSSSGGTVQGRLKWFSAPLTIEVG